MAQIERLTSPFENLRGECVNIQLYVHTCIRLPVHVDSPVRTDTTVCLQFELDIVFVSTCIYLSCMYINKTIVLSFCTSFILKMNNYRLESCILFRLETHSYNTGWDDFSHSVTFPGDGVAQSVTWRTADLRVPGSIPTTTSVCR